MPDAPADHDNGPDNDRDAAPCHAPDRAGQRVEGGIGPRLDALLAAAEQEAGEIRDEAERHAAALLRQVHTELETHEREHRRQWQERRQAVLAAESALHAERAAIDREAAQLRAEAERDAQRLRAQAHYQAREITTAAAQAAEQAAADALTRVTAELQQLHQRRDNARAEIHRLLRTLDGIRDALRYELDTAPAAAGPGTDDGDRRRASGTGDERSGAGVTLGQRPGDLYRARRSGLLAAVTPGSDTPGTGSGERETPSDSG